MAYEISSIHAVMKIMAAAMKMASVIGEDVMKINDEKSETNHLNIIMKIICSASRHVASSISAAAYQ